VHHAIEGFKKLFSDPVMVEPLPPGAYEPASDDHLTAAMEALLFLVAVDLEQLFEHEDGYLNGLTPPEDFDARLN
jgi:hypothetical protein